MKRNQKRKVGMKKLLKNHTIYCIEKKKTKLSKTENENNCIEKNYNVKK